MNISPFQRKPLKDESRSSDPVFTKYLVDNGNVSVTDDDNKAYAKNSDKKYYVKFASSTGEMFNPWESLNVEGELNLSKGGVSKYTWMSVNKNVYQLYIRFLETKNKVYYENAKGAI
jgi:hypothetical protein